MKRHDSLAPLSREHHGTLILAQLLKRDAPPYKGLPGDPAGKAAHASELFQQSIATHFEKEDVLLAKVAGWHPGLQASADEIRREHGLLRSQFQGLATSADLVSDLDRLGRELEQHIRKEERLLFPLVESHCSTAELNELKTLL